jgi:hypothetical protein
VTYQVLTACHKFHNESNKKDTETFGKEILDVVYCTSSAHDRSHISLASQHCAGTILSSTLFPGGLCHSTVRDEPALSLLHFLAVSNSRWTWPVDVTDTSKLRWAWLHAVQLGTRHAASRVGEDERLPCLTSLSWPVLYMHVACTHTRLNSWGSTSQNDSSRSAIWPFAAEVRSPCETGNTPTSLTSWSHSVAWDGRSISRCRLGRERRDISHCYDLDVRVALLLQSEWERGRDGHALPIKMIEFKITTKKFVTSMPEWVREDGTDMRCQ